jgi:hypothetical protein
MTSVIHPIARNSQPNRPSRTPDGPARNWMKMLLGNCHWRFWHPASGGQFWTPIPRLTGSVFHAGSHPQSREGEQRSVLAHSEPRRRLAGSGRGVFAERCRWHEAAVPRRKPAPPVRTGNVADVGDRLAAKLRRSRHCPSAMTSSRSPSALLRTIGASWSEKSRGMPGGCPSCRGRCGTGRGSRPGLWFPNTGCTCEASLSFDSGPAVNRCWPRHAGPRAGAASRAAEAAQGPAGRRRTY